MKNKINIAIIGCADIASRKFLPALKSLTKYYNLVAVASRDYDKAKQLSIKYKCIPVVGYENILNIENIDAVYIPLPVALHAKWVTFFLNAGKHVYIEKPASESLIETKRLIKLAKSKSLCLFEGYMFQYHNQHKLIKNIISDSVIGNIKFFSGSFFIPMLNKDNIRYNKQLGGGSLLDLAGYPLRAAQIFLGDLTVAGSVLNFNKKGIDIDGSALLKNKNGICASISFGLDSFYKNEYEIFGTKGKILLKRAFTPPADLVNKIYIELEGKSYSLDAKPEDHFKSSLKYFYNSINSDKHKILNYEEIKKQSFNIEEIKKFALS